MAHNSLKGINLHQEGCFLLFYTSMGNIAEVVIKEDAIGVLNMCTPQHEIKAIHKITSAGAIIRYEPVFTNGKLILEPQHDVREEPSLEYMVKRLKSVGYDVAMK